ncbi:hypothetical protein J6590_030917 [Homalodisca vitripennis]|nr:hypothetical protein J6590_030917 [Homalodisca vitripennis]
MGLSVEHIVAKFAGFIAAVQDLRPGSSYGECQVSPQFTLKLAHYLIGPWGPRQMKRSIRRNVLYYNMPLGNVLYDNVLYYNMPLGNVLYDNVLYGNEWSDMCALHAAPSTTRRTLDH